MLIQRILRFRNFEGPNVFQTPMMEAPCVNSPTSCYWFWGYVYLSVQYVHIRRLTIIYVQFYLRHFFVHVILSMLFVSMTYYIDNFLFIRQFCPLTCVCTQYSLRMKALGGDITRYSCFQVIVNDLNVTIIMNSNYITLGHYRCTYGYHMCLSLVSSDIHI